MTTFSPTPEAIAALAPTGILRASINLGNPILASCAAGGSSVQGVSVDLASNLAEAISLPLELVVVESAGQSVANVDAGLADFGFFALDPQRAATMLFTAPYVLIAGAYLVRMESGLTSASEVDSIGTSVCVGKGSAYDLFLSRALQNASIYRADTSPAVVDTFLAKNVDVAAGVRQQLEFDIKRLGLPLRILPENFMTIQQAMAVPRRSGDAARDLLHSFVQQQKSNGFVQQRLQHHGIEGAQVAPVGEPIS